MASETWDDIRGGNVDGEKFKLDKGMKFQQGKEGLVRIEYKNGPARGQVFRLRRDIAETLITQGNAVEVGQAVRPC